MFKWGHGGEFMALWKYEGYVSMVVGWGLNGWSRYGHRWEGEDRHHAAGLNS